MILFLLLIILLIILLQFLSKSTFYISTFYTTIEYPELNLLEKNWKIIKDEIPVFDFANCERRSIKWHTNVSIKEFEEYLFTIKSKWYQG